MWPRRTALATSLLFWRGGAHSCDVTGPSSASDLILAELAHELRTPLGAIIGFADAMREEAFGPLNTRYGECAQAIHDAGAHLLAMVEDLTSLARPKPAPYETFDAMEATRRTVALMAGAAGGAGVALACLEPATRIEVLAQPVAIRRILINLIANAIAATPRGGRIDVVVAADGADLVLAVNDSGPGLAVASKGRGLGLALVEALCTTLGGTLAIGHSPVGGAALLVRLPIVAGV